MSTRSKSKAQSASSRSGSTSNNKSSHTSSKTNPPRVFILPSAPHTDPDSPPPELTIITLPHPHTSKPTRYLCHSYLGLHEIKKISSSTSAVPRSWLFTVPENHGAPPALEDEEEETWIKTGQILSQPTLYLTTPIDPLFLLLPHLLAKQRNYIPLDDLIDSYLESEPHWKVPFKHGTRCEERLRERIIAISDCVDAGGEMSYKVSEEKVLAVLKEKVERMAEGEFPKSVEEEFVKKVLARPAGAVVEVEVRKEEETTITEEDKENDTDTTAKAQMSIPTTLPQLPTPEASFHESEKPTSSVITTTTTTNSTLSITAATPTPHTPPHITHLLRLRLSLSLLLTLLPPSLSTTTIHTHYPMAPLTIHLTHLTTLRATILALRSSDYSMKRSLEDEELASERKKAKKEQEEAEKKRKKAVSQGVRNLNKVNTRGMAKMTSFFSKKT